MASKMKSSDAMVKSVKRTVATLFLCLGIIFVSDIYHETRSIKTYDVASTMKVVKVFADNFTTIAISESERDINDNESTAPKEKEEENTNASPPTVDAEKNISSLASTLSKNDPSVWGDCNMVLTTSQGGVGSSEFIKNLYRHTKGHAMVLTNEPHDHDQLKHMPASFWDKHDGRHHDSTSITANLSQGVLNRFYPGRQRACFGKALVIIGDPLHTIESTVRRFKTKHLNKLRRGSGMGSSWSKNMTVKQIYEVIAEAGEDQTGIVRYVESWYEASQDQHNWPEIKVVTARTLYTHAIEIYRWMGITDEQFLEQVGDLSFDKTKRKTSPQLGISQDLKAKVMKAFDNVTTIIAALEREINGDEPSAYDADASSKDGEEAKAQLPKAKEFEYTDVPILAAQQEVNLTLSPVSNETRLGGIQSTYINSTWHAYKNSDIRIRTGKIEGGRFGHQLKTAATSIIISTLYGTQVETPLSRFYGLMNWGKIEDVDDCPSHWNILEKQMRTNSQGFGGDLKAFRAEIEPILQEAASQQPVCLRLLGHYRVHVYEIWSWEKQGEIPNGTFDSIRSQLKMALLRVRHPLFLKKKATSLVPWAWEGKPSTWDHFILPREGPVNVVAHMRRGDMADKLHKVAPSDVNKVNEIMQKIYLQEPTRTTFHLVTEKKNSGDVVEFGCANLPPQLCSVYTNNTLATDFNACVNSDVLILSSSSMSTWAAVLGEHTTLVAPNYNMKHFWPVCAKPKPSEELKKLPSPPKFECFPPI